jgi:hypothetical protein
MGVLMRWRSGDTYPAGDSRSALSVEVEMLIIKQGQVLLSIREPYVFQKLRELLNSV